jgi:hypothetical protein
MWGTRSYFDAEGFAWGFHGKLKLPPRTAEHGNVLEIAREAFHAAAGLPNRWPCGMAFFVVHCDISEMMSADDGSAIQIPVRGFQNARMSVLYKNEGQNSGPERSCTELGDAKT